MNYPDHLLYAKSHEWAEIDENGIATVGITDFAQHELGDLVFVNLPMAGDEVEAGKPFGDVESVKAVSDVFSPVSGIVLEINEELLDQPQLINEAPYEAWFMKVENAEAGSDLMDYAAYEKMISEEE